MLISETAPLYMVHVQVPEGVVHLFRRPIDLDRNVGPSAIRCKIPVVTGYLTRICDISC